MRLLPLLLVLAACATTDEAPTDTDDALADNNGVTETEGVAACDNLDGDFHCLLPFPSDRLRDATTGQLAFVQDAMPTTSAGAHLSVDAFTQDGFGVSSPILFQLAGATLDGLPDTFDAAASLKDDARTVLIDAATGARIPHWVEHDWLDKDDPNPILLIRAAVPLPPGARIVVGVRGLVDSASTVLDAPEGFASLRDSETSTRIGVHARRAHYEDDIFPVLEQAGFARAELQLAWDFTTRTDANAQQDLAELAAGMYAALGDGGPSFDEVEVKVVSDDPNLALIVDAVAHIPSFLLPPDEGGVRLLRRDADGHVVTDGFEDVPFRIQVPPSVLEEGPAAPVLQYGHGFLGSRDEANNSWLREMAQRHRFMTIAADMQGMSEANTGAWMQVLLSDAGHMGHLADEAMQGVANHLALQRLLGVSMGGEAPAELAPGGDVLWDPEQLWYHGNSQGGTMGTLVLTASRDVTRGVLGVPGCAFPFLLDRSVDFVDWAGALELAYPNPGDLTVVLALLGTAWDRMDGLTWADRMATDPLPDTPPHQALLHVGLEDAQVMNQVSWVLARSLGAVQPTTNVRPIWDVPTTALPVDASPAVIVNWDFKVDPDPTPLDPPVKETDTHSAPRRLHEAQDQSVHFLATGEVIDTCGGEACVFDRP